MALATTINSWVALIRNALEGCGIAADALLLQVGIQPEQLQDHSARVPTSQVIRLWHLAVEETGDPCFGLEVGKRWHPTSFHALGFAWLASETLDEALQCLVRYSRTVTTLARLSVRPTSDGLDLEIDTNPVVGLEPAPATLDAGLGSVVTMCRMSAGEGFRPLAVFVRGDKSACADRYENFFRAPVSFEAERTAVRFAAEDLAKLLPASNMELAHLNEQVVSRYLAQLDRSNVAMRVKAYLVDHLPAGNTHKEDVARHLNLSVRSLQRHLKSQNTSYNDLLEQTRRELAARFLRSSGMSILSLIHISEPTRQPATSRMPSSA